MQLTTEKLGIRTAEKKHFSHDNEAFTPDTTVTLREDGRSSHLPSRVPSIALAQVHLSAGKSAVHNYATSGPLQRVTSIANQPYHVLRIKPYQKEVKKLNSQIRTDFTISLIRNILCGVFLTCLVITFLEEHHIPDWFIKKKIPGLIFLLCGLIGVIIQVAHVTSLLRGGSPTVISRMLRNAKSRDEFIGIMNERRTAAPFMAVEVMLKTHANKKTFTNHNHWVHLTKESLKSLVYNTWDDQSTQIDNAMKNKSCWLILAKDYISDCVNTRKSFEKDIDSFREVTGFDKYLARLKLRYILDVQKGEYFPDAEPHFIFDETAPLFQSIQLYTIASFMALDFIYVVLFYLVTKNAGVCRLVKCMSRVIANKTTDDVIDVEQKDNTFVV